MAVAGSAAACTAAEKPAGAPVSSATADALAAPAAPPASAPPRPLDLAALRRTLKGQLVTRTDRGYPAARRGFNPNFDTNAPLAVAQCATEADVQACVTAAAASRTPVVARSGGHSYAGYSNATGALVVDLGRLAGVQVGADGTAQIGAGARLGSVYSALAARGRALAAGSCPTVGIAGLTLGGGVGVLTRRYGLTCDQLTALRIVTADGQLRTVSASASPDLFWALRGGGGGNLGIVTALTFHTVPAPQLAVLSVHFPVGSAAQVFGAWQQWLPCAPAELWTKCAITTGSSPSVRLTGCHVGSVAAARGLVADLVRRTGAAGSVTATAKSFGAAMQYFAGSPDRESFHACSRILTHPADAGKVAALARGASGTSIQFDALGGAVRTPPAGGSAFAYRDALATVQIYRTGTATEPVTRIRDELGALTGNTGYVNYIDPTLRDWGAAYYGPNVARLRDIAHTHDPNGVFRFAQGLAAA